MVKIVAVIMAGGVGERFWPKSRVALPKQFLSLTADGITLIQSTVDRISSFVAIEDTFVVTNERYRDLVIEQLNGIPEENIILEPIGRNTAPCISVAAGIIEQKYGNALMLVLPSDHIIKDNNEFERVIKLATDAVSGDKIFTIGIKPDYPETGYGYIKYFKSDVEIKQVEKFVEKPNHIKASEYLEDGGYLWNSGIFLFTAETILKNIKKFMPDLYSGTMKIKNAFGSSEYTKIFSDEFHNFKSESIDYGIMEKAENIYIISGSFGWDDCGSWLALDKINQTDLDGNFTTGDVVILNSHNSTVVANDKLIATVGLENIIVVDTPDALLVCSKTCSQDVKKVIQILKDKKRSNLL